MEMASKGDGGTTDVFAKHLKSKGVDGATGEYPDLYSAFADDHLLFSFGQGTTKSNGELFQAFWIYFSSYNFAHGRMTNLSCYHG